MNRLAEFCPCGGTIKLKFHEDRGHYMECDKCERYYPIDIKQRPREDVLLKYFDEEIERVRRKLEILEQRKENIIKYYKET